MKPEDQKFFDEARELFLQPGWATFVSELEVMAANITFDSCSTSDEFWASKGALNAVRQIMAYEAMVKQGEEEAEE